MISSVGRKGLTVVSAILGIVKGHSASSGGFRWIAQLTADLSDLKSDRIVPWLMSLLLRGFSLLRVFLLATFFLLAFFLAAFSFPRLF